MTKSKAISVVVPVFNNENILPELSQRLHYVLQSICGPEFEIIFVDDCSIDNSFAVLKKLSAAESGIKIIPLKKNIGQWEATLLGISRASGEYIVTIDADLQYDPADILKLYQHLIANSLLLVYGIPSRMLSGAGKVRNEIQNLILKKSWTSSFKILHHSVVFHNNNHFIPDRHFECHEKFYLSPEKKGWIKVNTDVNRHGRFRRNVFRNVNVMLTYLPEYNLHFRHPMISAGVGLLLLALLMIIAVNFTGMSWKTNFLQGTSIVTGILLIGTGMKCKTKYRQILKARKDFLSRI